MDTLNNKDKIYEDLLGFLYPIHYQIGMELERRMCQEKLSRQQAAILWLIESEVGLYGWMPRKRIEQALHHWFESRKSHVTQLIRLLSDPPLSLVVQKTNPNSRREKLVALTDDGRELFESMIDAGVTYFSELLPHMNPADLKAGMTILRRAFGPLPMA